MSFEMIDRDEGLVDAPSEPFGHRCADNEPTDQPRTYRRSHTIDVGEGHFCLIEGPYDNLVEMVEMRPRGDLGYHPTIR